MVILIKLKWKRTKTPANPLSFSCKKHVQATSLYYKNVGKENMQKKLSKPAERCIVRKGLFLTCPFFQLYQPPSAALLFLQLLLSTHQWTCMVAVAVICRKNPTEPKKDVWMAEPFNIRSYMSQFSDKTYHISHLSKSKCRACLNPI